MDSVFQWLFKYRPFLFEKGQIIFDSSLSPWLIPLLAVGGGALALFLYRRRVGPDPFSSDRAARRLSAARLLGMSVLRTAALAVLLLMIFRPTLVVSSLLPRENLVAVLIDDSKSMTLRDAAGKSRIEAVRQLIDPSESEFVDSLERRFQTRFFSFSRDNQRLRSAADLKAEGGGTSLEAGLQGALRELSAVPLVSVVVISDGADNASENLSSIVNEYRAKKVSISAIGVGQTTSGDDIEVSQVSAPASVLPDSVTQAVVSLRSSGFAGQEAVVEVREGAKLVNSKKVRLQGGDEPQIVEVDLAPKGTGLKSYTVSVAPQASEAISVNNRQDLLLEVEDSHPKILYLEGSPRWEFKFIRQAFEKEKNLQLVTLLRTSGAKFYRQGIESEDNLAAGFPTSRDELFTYKGVILGSIESAFFSAEQMRMLADFVSLRGGGFMMLGGRRSFDAGKYQGTPIAEILPVVLGERSAERSYQTQPVKFELTSYGREHPITRLVQDDAANETRWRSLPEIGDFNWISTAKPGATVLARGGGRNSPVLLAAQRYGRGRTLAFTGDSSWRWRMEMSHQDDSHQVFWRQTLRWLVGSAPDQVSLNLPESVYSDGDTVRLNAEINDPSFNGVNDATVQVVVTAPSGKVTESSLRWSGRKDGVYAGAVRPSELGTHDIRITASRDGKELGSARQYALVTESNQEFFNSGQNRTLLTHLASQTGGSYYSLGDAGRLPEELVYQDRPNALPQYLPLWDMPILFLIVCAALIAEWALRRKQGFA